VPSLETLSPPSPLPASTMRDPIFCSANSSFSVVTPDAGSSWIADPIT
jgi:hypothetical protein